MRLNRLDLIRYGKFTNTPIDLPRGVYDFHLIVGPNEAGKSTVRTAVAELLFGMPKSSPLGFVHPQSELRLGAVIEGGPGQLAFHRTKSTKSSLRSPTDALLPDDALAGYLDSADRSFFEQMFGLDHVQLVKGGQSILDASKDVGQVLFQSAAGIAGLGKVRDALADEAGTLWGPRKAGDRAYYIAAAQLEAADHELKEATIRTRAWAEARSTLEAAESRFGEVRKALQGLEESRAKLERLRRLSPLVQTLRAKTAELQELGEVVDLPADASRSLSDGQAALSVAEAVLRHRQEDVVRLTSARDLIRYNGSILSRQKEIEGLEAFRHRVRDHARDIVLHRRQVDLLLEQVRESCAELGWPTGEEHVRALLPSAIALKTVDRLLKTRGAIQQSKATTSKAVADRLREVEGLERELAGSPDAEIAPELRAALVDAQALRNTAITQQGLTLALEDAERTLADALAALGKWSRPIESLKAMTVPSADRLTSLRNERASLEADVKAARERVSDAERVVDEAQLEVDQYSATQRIVTADDVGAARARRDMTWGEIKSGATSIEAGIPALDSEIVLADQLVDTQVGTVTAAAELQSLRQRVEREEANLSRVRSALTQKERFLQDLDDAWTGEAVSLTLDGLPLGDAPAWLARRDVAISAAATFAQKKGELEKERAAASVAMSTLMQHLQEAGHSFEGTSLAAACATAERFLRESDASQERRQALIRQIEQGRRSLEVLQVDSKAASEAYCQWESEWSDALSTAKLGVTGKTPAEAEAALELVTRIVNGLDKATAIRRDRIETMNHDLEQFADQAWAVAVALEASAQKPSDAAQFSRQLGEQLEAAKTARERWLAADEELSRAIEQRDAAQLEVSAATARVAPLLAAAGAASLADALPRVERSDRRRQLLHAIDDAKTSIAADTDGLGLEAALAEVDGAEIATLHGQIETVSHELTEVHNRLTAATEERLRAQQAFSAISGGANAAIAEAKRQEALAAMADASERYLKVATASRLLRWAIDKYRDRKQGPMLSRAGAIFTWLTLGRYRKLIVDYDKEPLSLAAQRATGEVVEVPGLSEGTRDQLYLALRLAALELRAEQATPLPFIADDLFINFDDDRSKAGLGALRDLARTTQVIFLTHHDHLTALVREVFGANVNVVELTV